MAPRLPKQNPRNPTTPERDAFAEQYETLAVIYGDPVEVVFAIMDKNFRLGDDELALRAAEDLISYRFPRIKAMENAGGQSGPTLNFVINTSGIMPAPHVELDVTPSAPVEIDMKSMLGDG